MYSVAKFRICCIQKIYGTEHDIILARLSDNSNYKYARMLGQADRQTETCVFIDRLFTSLKVQ